MAPGPGRSGCSDPVGSSRRATSPTAATSGLAGGFRAATRRRAGPTASWSVDAILGWHVMEHGAQLRFEPGALVHHRHFPATYPEWLRDRGRGAFPGLMGRSDVARQALWHRVFLAHADRRLRPRRPLPLPRRGHPPSALAVGGRTLDLVGVAGGGRPGRPPPADSPGAVGARRLRRGRRHGPGLLGRRPPPRALISDGRRRRGLLHFSGSGRPESAAGPAQGRDAASFPLHGPTSTHGPAAPRAPGSDVNAQAATVVEQPRLSGRPRLGLVSGLVRPDGPPDLVRHLHEHPQRTRRHGHVRRVPRRRPWPPRHAPFIVRSALGAEPPRHAAIASELPRPQPPFQRGRTAPRP